MKEIFEGFRKYLIEQETTSWPLKRGSRGPAVEKLQAFLAQTDKQVQITGVFDSKTEKALKAFQTKTFTSPTGIVDRDYFNIIIGGKFGTGRIGKFVTDKDKADIGQVAYDKWVKEAVVKIENSMTAQGISSNDAKVILSWFAQVKKAIISQEGVTGWKKFAKDFVANKDFIDLIKENDAQQNQELRKVVRQIFGNTSFVIATMKRYEKLEAPLTRSEKNIIKQMNPRKSYLLFNQAHNAIYWMGGSWKEFPSKKHTILKSWRAVSGHADAFPKLLKRTDKKARAMIAQLTKDEIEELANVASQVPERYLKLDDPEDIKTLKGKTLRAYKLFTSKALQRWKDNGPLPEGVYTAGHFQKKPPFWKNWRSFFSHMLRTDASGIESELDPIAAETFYKVLEKVGLIKRRRGRQPTAALASGPGSSEFYQGKSWNLSDGRSIGGRPWGFQRAWLTPRAGKKGGKTYTYGRAGFSIHGGDSLGSSGCVDLGPAMSDFARHWQNAVGSGKIVLIADYGNFPQRRTAKPETGASTPGATV